MEPFLPLHVSTGEKGDNPSCRYTRAPRMDFSTLKTGDALRRKPKPQSLKRWAGKEALALGWLWMGHCWIAALPMGLHGRRLLTGQRRPGKHRGAAVPHLGPSGQQGQILATLMGWVASSEDRPGPDLWSDRTVLVKWINTGRNAARSLGLSLRGCGGDEQRGEACRCNPIAGT